MYALTRPRAIRDFVNFPSSRCVSSCLPSFMLCQTITNPQTKQATRVHLVTLKVQNGTPLYVICSPRRQCAKTMPLAPSHAVRKVKAEEEEFKLPRSECLLSQAMHHWHRSQQNELFDVDHETSDWDAETDWRRGGPRALTTKWTSDETSRSARGVGMAVVLKARAWRQIFSAFGVGIHKDQSPPQSLPS